MATEIDYGAVLADLEAKRAAIDGAIAGVRQMLNLGAEQAVGTAPTAERKEQPAAVRFDAFFRMSMPAAITKFLEMSKAPQSVSDLTKALLDGGFKTTSKNLMAIVGSNLSRMKSAGETVNVEGKWGLASWYPAARNLDVAAKPKGRKRGRPKGSTKPTPELVEQIKRLQAAGKKPGEIATEVGLHRLTVGRILKPRKAAA